MSQHRTNAYQSVRRASLIENKSPHELTLMLFDGALSQMALAAGDIECGDNNARGTRINKTLAITMELQGTLKDPDTNEVAGNLYRLYSFVITQLLAANRHNDSAALRNAHDVMITLRDAWASISPDMAIAA